jgi:trk system potassium uptake protein TrkH
VRVGSLNWVGIRRVFGFILLLLAATMLVPLFWAIYYDTPDWQAFIWSIIIVGVPGALLLRGQSKASDLGARDAFVIVAGSWIVCSVAGAVPFVTSGELPNVFDAIFESMSGFSTTGATVMTRIEIPAAGILFWRSFLHWLGGMGIILAFLAFFPYARRGGDSLYKAEVPGMEVERLTPRLRQTAVVLWRIYGTITVLQTACLCLAGMTLYESLIHTFGTVATGGFSNRALSVGAYANPWIHYIILAFMFLSGVNFALYYRAVHTKKISEIFKDPELRTYAGIAAVATLIIWVNLAGTYGAGQSLHHSAFQVVSVMTTTGYVTADFDLWPELSKGVLLLLMFVGPCSGSTGGSVKVVRYMVVAKSISRELSQMVHARAVLPIRIGGRVIPESTVRNVLVFMALYMLCALAGTMYMLYCGLSMVEAISAVAATLGNVGPGLGSIGPSLSFAAVPDSGIAVLTALMMLGRLELFTVFVTVTPGFWRR